MVLDNLFPVFALLLFGHLLKRVGITHDAFLKTADKLIYYIFFPVLLFWKIGAAASDLIGDPGLYKAAICAVVSVYAVYTSNSLRYQPIRPAHSHKAVIALIPISVWRLCSMR
jgi:predicted permease